MYSVTATFSFTCLALLSTTMRSSCSPISLNISHPSTQSNISSKAVLAALTETTDLREINLQFLYAPEYEGVVQVLAENLSMTLIGQMRFRYDGNIDVLLQMLAPSPRQVLLVVLERPPNLIKMFQKIRKKRLYSHLAKWLILMEESSEADSVLELEELVNEGTNVTVCKINSSGYCDLFFSYVDNKGITRFADKTTIRERKLITKEDNNYYSLNGRELRVGIKTIKLFTKLGETLPDGSIQVISGIEVTLLKTLAKTLNFTYRAYVPEDNHWGNLQPDGNVTGIIGMVARREVTFAMSLLAISESREFVVDFAWYSVGAVVVIVSTPPKEISKALTILYPFQPEVWATSIIAVLSMGPVVYLFSHLNGNKDENGKNDLWWLEFNMFRGIVNQGIRIKDTSRSTRIIFMFWLLFCVIFTAIYSGMLTAMFALPTFEPPIDYLEDLPGAVKRGYTIGVLRDSYYEQLFRTSTDGIYKQTWHLFNHKDRSKSFMESQIAGGRKVVSEKFVYIVSDTFGRYFQRLFGTNRIYLGRGAFNPIYAGIACQTGSPVKDTFLYVLLRLQGAGLIFKWMDEGYRKVAKEQSSEEEEISQSSAISLTHLQAAFYMLFLGLSVASIILLLEILIFKKRK